MILFENVSKKYRGTQRPALDNISFEITRGEFVFIVGASGSGKSSCLRLILREEQPTNGRIHVLGHDLGKISSRKVPYFRRNLGVVFQDFRLLTNKTVYDNVAFSLQVIGKSRGFIQEAVPDTLKMVGLEGKEKRYPHELSGGEQQRVAIARAIVNKPSVLLADEPTGNLDPATSLGIMQLLRAINAAGTTIVMATHEAAFVDIMQQRVIEISQGVIVRDEQSGGYGETASIPMIDLSQAGSRTMRTPDDLVRQTLAPEVPAEPLNEAATNGETVSTGTTEPVSIPTLMRSVASTAAVETAHPASPITAVAGTPGVHTGSAHLAEQPASGLATPEAVAEPMPEVSDQEFVAGDTEAQTVVSSTPQQNTQINSDKLLSSLPEFLKPAVIDQAAIPVDTDSFVPTTAESDAAAVAPQAMADPARLPHAHAHDALQRGQADFETAPELAAPVLDEQLEHTITAEEYARENREQAVLDSEERDPVKLAAQGGWAKRLGLTARENDDQTDVGPVR